MSLCVGRLGRLLRLRLVRLVWAEGVLPGTDYPCHDESTLRTLLHVRERAKQGRLHSDSYRSTTI